MSPVSIDLDAQIESLRGFLTDLDEHYWLIVESRNESRRYAFTIAIAQLAQRITMLEEIVRHHGHGEVVFPQLTGEESRNLGRALGLLDGEFLVGADTAQAELWARVRDLLAAVDVLMLTAARGACAQDVDHERAPRLGVVLPLARSGR